VKTLSFNFHRVAGAAIATLIGLGVVYAAFLMVGFDVFPFRTVWIALPVLSMMIFLFVANNHNVKQLKPMATAYAANRANWKIATIFAGVFVTWALARSIGDWLIGGNYIDHGACSRWDFSDTSCGSEDLNGPRRVGLAELIDKFASATFVMLPFALLNSKIQNWLGQE
jgi:hypothetical protein